MNMEREEWTVLEDMPIPLTGALLHGDLTVPPAAHGLVLFAHGSGSGRKSPRNRLVAEILQDHGFGTLLFDLLTAREEAEEDLRFAIDLLTERLMATTEWIMDQPGMRGMTVGLFGASTGAASALNTAAAMPEVVKAVVSRGGRPDLAMDALPRVKAPTLLIVGGLDGVVIDMNRAAYEAMVCEKHLEIVPGATHLFEEPGKLEVVARLAADWYERFL